VQKVTEKDVDDMVDASKEYINKVDDVNDNNRDNMKSRLNNIINMIRSLKEEAPVNNASSGNIAGLPPDQPPVKQKKRYIYGGHGSRRMWLANRKNGKQ
jgi:hypothetical protein